MLKKKEEKKVEAVKTDFHDAKDVSNTKLGDSFSPEDKSNTDLKDSHA